MDAERHYWFDLRCPQCDAHWQPLAEVRDEDDGGRSLSLKQANSKCWRGHELKPGDEVVLCLDEGPETVQRTTYVIPDGR